MQENLNSTQVEPALSVSVQAKLLARFLKDKGLATLTHSQALEALAHANNVKSYNVLKSKPATKPAAKEATAEDLLRQAIAKGMTAGMALNVFAESRSDTESAFLEAARENHAREGELEFDDNAVVSLSEDGGAYVMGWRWVYLSEVAAPGNLVAALRLGFDHVSVLLEDQDVDHDFDESHLELNDAALERYAAGEAQAPETWLVRGLNRDEARFELTVRHFDALEFNEDSECFEGELDGNTLELCFHLD